MLGGDAMKLGMLPTTIPGQGMPMQVSQPVFGYPNGSDQQRQYAPGAQAPIVINAAGVPIREATSTALVQPTPYRGIPVHTAPPAYAAPAISRRTKLILGGVGLSLFAAIATVAIIKGSSSRAKPTEPSPTTKPTLEASEPPKKATFSPIVTPTDPPKVVTPTITPKTDPPKVVTPTITPKTDPPKVVTPTITPKTDPPKVVAKVDPPKVVAPTVTPKTDPPKVVKTEPAPKKEPPPKVVKIEPAPKKEPPPKVVKTEPAPKKEPPPKRVATADLNGYKSRADELYKAKNFAGASAALKAGSTNVGEEDAKELRNLAAIYSQFGKAYALGMAPGTAPKDALEQLKKAKNLDGSAGGAYTGEIEGRIGQVAPKAAVAVHGREELRGCSGGRAARRECGQQQLDHQLGEVRARVGRAHALQRCGGPEGLGSRRCEAEAPPDPEDRRRRSSPWYQKAGEGAQRRLNDAWPTITERAGGSLLRGARTRTACRCARRRRRAATVISFIFSPIAVTITILTPWVTGILLERARDLPA